MPFRSLGSFVRSTPNDATEHACNGANPEVDGPYDPLKRPASSSSPAPPDADQLPWVENRISP